MKRIISSILALAMVYTMVQVGIVTASATQGGYYLYEGHSYETHTSGNYTYILFAESQYDCPQQMAMVIDCNGLGGPIVLPNLLDGNPVTCIASEAFKDNTQITKLIIPMSVTIIGEGAFNGCTGLTDVEIEGNLKILEPDTFKGCSNLGTVILPDSNVFNTIAHNSFENCTSLATITIPKSVNTIGNAAFTGCSSLSSVYFLGNAPKEMGSGVFPTSGLTVFYVSGKTGFAAPWNGFTPVTFTPVTLSASTTNPTSSTVGITVDFTAGSTSPQYKIGTGAWIPYVNGIPTAVSNELVYARCVFANGKASNIATMIVFNIYKPDEYNYSQPDSEGHVTIKKYIGDNNGNLESIVMIPNVYVDGANIEHPVTSIFGDEHNHYNAINYLTIPNSITIIGEYAFYYAFGLARVAVLGNNLTLIDTFGFKFCTNLNEVIIPNSVTHISWAAFKACAFSEISALSRNSNLEFIGQSAFGECNSLKTVYIPASVSTIDISAFSPCDNLTDIDVSPDNPNFSSQNGVLFNYDKTTIIQYPGGKAGSYELPNTVTDMFMAFACCDKLTAVTINSDIDSGTYAFTLCNNLAVITFGSGVTSVNKDMLDSCSPLTEASGFHTIPALAQINVDSNNQTYSSIDGVLFKNGNTLIQYPYVKEGDNSTGICTIQNGVIGENAFKGCTGITNVTIGSGVTEIGEGAFAGCSNLTAINVIGNNVYSSQDGVLFKGNSLVQYPAAKTSTNDYSIPSYITEVYGSCFTGCSALTNISIPDGVTSIGAHAFDDTPWFKNNSNAFLIVGDHILIRYNSSNALVVIPNDVKTINYNVFEGKSISTVTIPDSVKSIGDNAFAGCENLQTVTFSASSGLISIGENAFAGCTKLPSFNIPNPVESIGDSAFAECENLATVAISASSSLTSIGKYAFIGCKALPSINVPNTVTSVGDGAFAECTSLTALPIGYPLSEIKEYVFYGCTGLTSITIPNSVTKIDSGAFYGCTGLTSVTIPNSVTKIDSGAFYSCTELTDIAIPDSVTEIGDYAFSECIKLSGVTLGIHVDSIGAEAFENCASLETVTIPDSVTSIGIHAFNGCNYMAGINIGSGLIPENDFMGKCTGLTQINVDESNQYLWSQNGVLFDKEGTTLLKCPMGKTGSYIIPEDVTEICDGAFIYCDKLTGVTIPDGVTSIGANAFSGCTGLIEANIPASVNSIGNYVFAACSSLTEINVDPNNMAYSDKDGVLFNKTKTILLAYPEAKGTAYTIPDGVTEIRAAFSANSSLTSVYIPNTVTTIGLLAFYQCTGLTSVTIPSSVNNFDFEAFWGCTNLTDAYFLGNAVTNTDSNTFGKCASGFKVHYISGKTGFTNPWCGYTTEIFDPLAAPSFTASPQSPTNSAVTVTISYPVSAAVKQYRIGSGDWMVYTVPVDLPTNDTVYARYTDANGKPSNVGSFLVNNIFKTNDYDVEVVSGSVTITHYNGSEATVMIPNVLNGYPVTSISAQAFSNCMTLRYITIPDNVTSIGDTSFNGCSNLSVINIGSGLNPDDGFIGECAGLTQINIADDNPYFSSRNGVVYDEGGTILLYCPRGKTGSYIIPDNTIAIGDGSFYGCSVLTSVTIPNSVVGIGGAAFFNCAGLTSVNYASNSTLASIGESAFYGCTGLTSLPLPNSGTVTDIDNWAFYNCSGLTNANIPEGVERIGVNAFTLCNSLTTVSIPSSLNSTGSYIFSACSHLTEINVDPNNQFFSSQDHVLFNKTKTTLITYPCYKSGTDYTIPSSVNNIDPGAFYGCQWLSTVSISSNISYIGLYAFVNCTSLTEINVDSNNPYYSSQNGVLFNKSATTLIQYPANKSGTSYPIPSSVTTIGGGSFNGSKLLTSMTVPDSVVTINEDAFANCYAMTQIIVGSNNINYSSQDGVLFNKSAATLIQYPAGKTDSSYTIPSSVTTVSKGAFQGNAILGSVIIPANVTDIGDISFYNCTNLTGAYFAGNAPAMGNSVFDNCGSAFLVYHHSGSTGFANPWYGYAAAIY